MKIIKTPKLSNIFKRDVYDITGALFNNLWVSKLFSI